MNRSMWSLTLLCLLAGSPARAPAGTGAPHTPAKPTGNAPAAENLWRQAAVYRIDYEVDLTPLARPGRRLRVWVPLPADGYGQRVEALEIDGLSARKTRDAFGNAMAYVELTPAEPPTALRLAVRARVRREPYTGRAAGEAHLLDAALKPQRKIPLSGPIRERAERVCRGLHGDGAKIRALYDHVLATMRYEKRGTGWGRGDALWACQSGYGNCTDFHSLLIGMARSEGIPAQFFMGFPIPADRRAGRVSGYHCWAELYDRQQRRWIPVDASEAWKAGQSQRYFRRLPADRIVFTVGRDLVLEPPQHGPPLNYFIYPYAELDGRPAGPVPWTLRFQRLEP